MKVLEIGRVYEADCQLINKDGRLLFPMVWCLLISWDVSADVSGMTLSGGATQLKCMTFVKMGITDNFPKYAQKYIKKNNKKEPKEESQSIVG